MKVIRTYTLPCGLKIENPNEEQLKLFNIDKRFGQLLNDLENRIKLLELQGVILEINTNYDGDICFPFSLSF